MDPATATFLITVALRIVFVAFILGFVYEWTEPVDDDDDDFDGGILQPVYVRNRWTMTNSDLNAFLFFISLVLIFLGIVVRTVEDVNNEEKWTGLTF